jgi:hypothetical protein
MSIRARFQVGRHLLTFADGGADWCRRCGTFDHNLGQSDCKPVPRRDRFWHVKKALREVLARYDLKGGDEK